MYCRLGLEPLTGYEAPAIARAARRVPWQERREGEQRTSAVPIPLC